MSMESLLSVIMSSVSIVVAVLSLYVSTRHKGVDLTLKYSEAARRVKDDKILNLESKGFRESLTKYAELASEYYLWRSTSRASFTKRTRFNYISVLVFLSFWIGYFINQLAFEGIVTAENVILWSLGCIVISVAVGVMSYLRYEKTLMIEYISCRLRDEYELSDAAIYKARDQAIVKETFLPIFLAVLISFLACHYLDFGVYLKIWLILGIVAGAGNVIQQVLSARKTGDTTNHTGDTTNHS